MNTAQSARRGRQSGHAGRQGRIRPHHEALVENDDLEAPCIDSPCRYSVRYHGFAEIILTKSVKTLKDIAIF